MAESAPDTIPTGFAYLDEHNQRWLTPTPQEVARFGGRSILTDTTILETPASVREAGRVLTNSTHIEYELVTVNGELVPLPTTWVQNAATGTSAPAGRANMPSVPTARAGRIYPNSHEPQK